MYRKSNNWRWGIGASRLLILLASDPRNTTLPTRVTVPNLVAMGVGILTSKIHKARVRHHVTHTGYVRDVYKIAT